VTTFAPKLLPRRCPLCGNRTIIGHGQRRKQAHDKVHDFIRIRRGRCPACHKTFTILPSGRLPTGTTALLAGNRRHSEASSPAAVGSKRLRALRIRKDLLDIHHERDGHPTAGPLHTPSLGGAKAGQPLVPDADRTLRSGRLELSWGTHHPRLGFARRLPYSAVGGKQSVNRMN